MISSTSSFNVKLEENQVKKLPILTLDLLSHELGVTCNKLLGKGRSSEVYSVSSNVNTLAGKLWKIKGKRKNNIESLANQEMHIARWAATKCIGPEVRGMRSTLIDTLYEPILLIMMLMEKMQTNLATFMGRCDPSEITTVWDMVFEQLKLDYTIHTELWSGWLCCDDLKPENILINYGTVKGRHKIKSVKFIDWDSRHCHVLPLSPECGIFLNTIILFFNTIIRGSHSGCFAYIPMRWPSEIQNIIFKIIHMAKHMNEDLLRFLTSLDKILIRGPYYYAGIMESAEKTPRERAVRFAEKISTNFEDICFQKKVDSHYSYDIEIKGKLNEIMTTMQSITSSRICALAGAINMA